jgi:hypothetical protein
MLTVEACDENTTTKADGTSHNYVHCADLAKILVVG